MTIERTEQFSARATINQIREDLIQRCNQVAPIEWWEVTQGDGLQVVLNTAVLTKPALPEYYRMKHGGKRLLGDCELIYTLARNGRVFETLRSKRPEGLIYEVLKETGLRGYRSQYSCAVEKLEHMVKMVTRENSA